MMAVTNRHLCDRDFLEQIEFLASTDIDAIILREKDMTPDEYEHLAKDVLMICHEHHKKCILHSFAEVAAKLNCENIHLPLPVLMELSEKDALEGFKHIGTSVHSVEDALAAEKAGATCLTAGHIFDTDCKKGLPGRGLTFLENVCHQDEASGLCHRRHYTGKSGSGETCRGCWRMYDVIVYEDQRIEVSCIVPLIIWVSYG